MMEKLIQQEIERRGPLDFSTFVDLALYHPKYGYYNQPGPRRGMAGDYFTSLQVSSLFPEIFAEAIMQMREALGCEQFCLIEIGSGGGEFLEQVMKSLSQKKDGLSGLRVWAIERSGPARDQLIKRLSRFPRCEVISSIQDIEWMGTLEGCIFSNEFFDALPFHRLKFSNGKWQEIYADIQNGSLREVYRSWSIDDTPVVSEGHEVEFRPQVPSIYEEWGNTLARGYVLTVDYGHPRESFYSPTRANGTWMCYHKHQSNKNIFEHLGYQDITAHVDFTQLVEAGRAHGFEPGLFCSQGIFLSYTGQKQIETYLASAPADEKRRRAAAIQQLVHPDAMGETFWTLVQAKGVELPPEFLKIPNRLRRLV